MPDADPDPPYGAQTLSALAAILALDSVTAARVRGLTPARRRPRRQTGPRLDLGGTDSAEDGAEDGADEA